MTNIELQNLLKQYPDDAIVEYREYHGYFTSPEVEYGLDDKGCMAIFIDGKDYYQKD